jgi:micrococcal nuclease
VRRLVFWAILAAALAAGAGGGVFATGGSQEAQRVPGTGVAEHGPGAAAAGSRIARVVRVVDGDTILVRLAGRRERLRYIGIDAPESVKPGAPVECFGPQASAFNRRLLEGEQVRLERDVSARDRYDRLLAYVYRVRDGLFVNAELVRRGFARARAYPPDTRHVARLAALERSARKEGRGLWRTCARARTQ